MSKMIQGLRKAAAVGAAGTIFAAIVGRPMVQPYAVDFFSDTASGAASRLEEMAGAGEKPTPYVPAKVEWLTMPTQTATPFPYVITPANTPYVIDVSGLPTATSTPEPASTPVAVPLENLVTTRLDAGSLYMGPYLFAVYQRFIPVKPLIEQFSARYGIDSIWATQLFIQESALKPFAANHVSSDYGIAQMKLQSFESGYAEGNDKDSPYFDPIFSDLPGDVFNVETAVAVAMLRTRFITDVNNLTTSDDVYAVYNMGPGGLTDPEKMAIAQTNIGLLRDKRSYVDRMAPTYLLSEEEVGLVGDPLLEGTIRIAQTCAGPQQCYEQMLAYNVGALESQSADPLTSAMLYYNAVIFAHTLSYSYGTDQAAMFDRLETIAGSLRPTVSATIGYEGTRFIDEARSELARARVGQP